MIEIETVDRMRDGHLVAHYLLSSYCYYQLDLSPMTDGAFDRLCERLKERLPIILKSPNPHMHAHIIRKGDIAAGTCLLKANAYPSRVIHHAHVYAEGCENGTVLSDLEPHLVPVEKQNIVTTRVRRSRLPNFKAPEATPEPAPTMLRVRRSRNPP